MGLLVVCVLGVGVVVATDGLCPDILKYQMSDLDGLSEGDRQMFVVVQINDMPMLRKVVKEKGANVHAEDAKGNRVLLWAAWYNSSREIVYFLLESGYQSSYLLFQKYIDLNYRSRIAESNEAIKIIQVSSKLLAAVLKLDVTRVKECIEAGACVNIAYCGGYRPLNYAAIAGKERVKTGCLLKSGLFVGAPVSDDHSFLTAKATIIQLLLEAGADSLAGVSSGKCVGWKAIDFAQRDGVHRDPIIKLLEEAMRRAYSVSASEGGSPEGGSGVGRGW